MKVIKKSNVYLDISISYLFHYIGNRFRDFHVKVLTSFDPNNPTAHTGEVCKYYTGIFPMRSLTQLTCDNKHSGRFVMISMPRAGVILNFCEVEVHPVSPPGTKAFYVQITKSTCLKYLLNQIDNELIRPEATQL